MPSHRTHKLIDETVLHKKQKGFILGRPWTEEEKRFLIKNYGKMPATEIAKRLDRTESAIRHKASRLGLHSNLKYDNLDRTQESTLSFDESMAAYLAGLIDGDGSITLTRNGHHNTYAPQIVISSKDMWFLEKISKIINGGKIRKVCDKRYNTTTYHLYFGKQRDCLLLAERLEKYSILKKRQLQLIREYCEIRLKRPKLERLKFTDREREIYYEIKRLNHRSKSRQYKKFWGDENAKS